jgi:hypothetical protein
MKYVCDLLEKTNKDGYTCFHVPHEQVKERSAAFAELHATRIGNKKASELQVLFLSGPEPLNDLEIMMELGIRPENVWAVESDKEMFDHAHRHLSEYTHVFWATRRFERGTSKNCFRLPR